MQHDLVDTIESLVLIMQEETARLQQGSSFRDHGLLTDAKLRLVAALETEVARLLRDGDDWLQRLDDGDRARLLRELARLHAASEPNARAIERRIDLSADMMDAVTAEAHRVAGTRSSTYCGQGIMTLAELSTPISVNTNL
jgi:hypothetical protein